MRQTFTLPGFEEQSLAVEYIGWLGKASLLVNGVPAAAADAPNSYSLTRDDGSQVAARVAFLRFGLVPVVYIETARHPLPSPLRWFHWPVVVLPLLLVGVGGMLGAVFGSIGFVINVRLLSGDRPGWMKIGAALAVSALLAGLFYLSAAIIRSLLGR